MDTTNQEKLAALLETLAEEEKEEAVELETTEESTDEKDDSELVASEEAEEEVEEKAMDEEETETEAEVEDDEEELEEEEEEKAEEEETEEKAEANMEEEELEEEEDVSDEEEEEEEDYKDDGAGRRVVLVEGEEVEEKAEEDEELIERRSALLAELAQIDQSLAKGEPIEELDAKFTELRSKRLVAMGYEEKDAENISEDAILCAVERKMLPNAEPCAFCRGGCAREKGLPGLLDIEAMAMDSFKGDILDSGYAPNDDLFVVDVKSEDGRIIEAFYDGEGNAAGWVLLANASEAEEKADSPERRIISMQEAEDIALKSVEGVVLGVDASVFEGYDSWAVQIEGVDGKSYDTYVSLDGQVLGFDEYDPTGLSPDLTDEEREEIKAIEAELYFKREFSRERREELAEEGNALPDGSFPIVSVSDLRNAIKAIGRAKNPEVAQAHIIKRATQLGREDLLPDNWNEKVEDQENFLKDLMDFQALTTELE